jgi:serine kinase of HPr protein (carbohydrate metabolism regulator)
MIAGLIEVPGIGPQRVSFEPGAVIDIVVRLVPAKEMPRFQEEAQEQIAGCAVPRLDLAAHTTAAALPAIAARLGLAPFV